MAARCSQERTSIRLRELWFKGNVRLWSIMTNCFSFPQIETLGLSFFPSPESHMPSLSVDLPIVALHELCNLILVFNAALSDLDVAGVFVMLGSYKIPKLRFLTLKAIRPLPDALDQLLVPQNVDISSCSPEATTSFLNLADLRHVQSMVMLP